MASEEYFPNFEVGECVVVKDLMLESNRRFYQVGDKGQVEYIDAYGLLRVRFDRDSAWWVHPSELCREESYHGEPYKALKDLIDDLDLRAEDGVVGCSNWVYVQAKRALGEGYGS